MEKNHNQIFSFIILNYRSTREAIECAMSIEKNDSYTNKYIILVDNQSEDSEQFFQEAFHELREYDNIVYLRSHENVGYARGNNIGIFYAKKVLKSDYVCVINPDTLIIEKDFVQKAIELYKKYKYAVCGPQIIHNGKNCNPLGGYKESKWFVFSHLVEDYRIYFVKKFNLAKVNIFKKLTNVRTKQYDTEIVKEKPESNRILKKEDGEQLSGACLVFSPDFLCRYNGFYHGTFLYCEETILTYACYQLGLKQLYAHEIKVEHKGGVSVKQVEGENRRRQMYVHKIGANSCKEVLKVYMHKKDKTYFEKILTPEVSEYSIERRKEA